MKNCKNRNYTDIIKRRSRILWAVLAAMLIYMITVSELGGGDSRIMTDLANMVSDIIFFGGVGYILYRIAHNKKLLKNRVLLKEQMRMELDERNEYLHDKSGGTVLDILLLALLFITMTAALFDMAAFYTALTALCLAILLKTAAYCWFSRR